MDEVGAIKRKRDRMMGIEGYLGEKWFCMFMITAEGRHLEAGFFVFLIHAARRCDILRTFLTTQGSHN